MAPLDEATSVSLADSHARGRFSPRGEGRSRRRPAHAGRTPRSATCVRTGLPVLVAVLLAGAVSAASDPASDRAITTVLRNSQPCVRHVKIWRRQQVTETLDVVVALGSERDAASAEGRASGPGVQPLGLFLQERGGRVRVYTLAVTRLSCEMAFLLHVSSSDIVFACESEKGQRHREKFVYDVRAKALVKAFTYPPYAVTSMRMNAGRVVVTASNGVQRVIADYDAGQQPAWHVRRTLADGTPERGENRCPPSPLAPSAPFGPFKSFQLVPWAEADNASQAWVVQERRGTATRHHRLPLSTRAEYAAARGHEHGDHNPGDVEIDDGIGPHAVFGDELWVGKSFYDGEGKAGVGGIAAFDISARRFKVFTGPLMAGWSAAAIYAEERSVWVSRVGHAELWTLSGGLVRFDRATQTFHVADEGLGIGCQFLSAGGRLLLGTDAGVTIVEEDRIFHVMFDEASDGRVRVVASER